MKRFSILLAVIFFTCILNAQETIRFRTDHPQGLCVESSTATELQLRNTISEIGIVDIDNGEAKGQEIIMKGSFGSFAEGLPNLPYVSRYIAVPQGASISVEVTEAVTETLEGIDLLPAAEVVENGALGLPRLHKDMSVYGVDAYFPKSNVNVVQTTRIRGLDVVLLHITPFRYNPVQKTLEVVYDMDIDIRFEGGNGQFGESRYLSPDWEGILRDLVVNGNMLAEPHYYDLINNSIRNREEGCEYLIISPDNDSVLAWADTLKRFRSKQGILTKVITTTTCGGNNPEAIKGYIQNAYEHWSIPPAAVLIFSGYQDTIVSQGYTPLYTLEESVGIPGFPLVFHHYNDNPEDNRNYLSDNPYGDMNGDTIPDIAVSRIPAITLQEYQYQVEKLIRYETNPPTDSHYYDRPTITSGYEENKWFLITSQTADGFFRHKLGKNPWNFYMVYESYYMPNLSEPDSLWSTGYNTQAVVDYFGPDGQGYIPRYPFVLDDWRQQDKNEYLVEALNSNSFMVLYRDHASETWCCPYFQERDVNALRSTEPTFLISIGCNTAQYQHSFYTGINQFLAEPTVPHFCQKQIGALGGIGSVTVTHSHFNDILTWGILDDFWPNFMPDHGSAIEEKFTRPAFSLVAGKLFLNENVFLPGSWPQKVIATHNVFHYLGETYLHLHTEVPRQLTIYASPYHPDNQELYPFTAEEGSLVCISYNDEIVQAVIATGQAQEIQLPSLTVGEQYQLTITKQGCRRYENSITIVSSAHAFSYLKEILFQDSNGNGQLDYGEYADFDITLLNVSSTASNGGTITLYSSSPYIEIINREAPFPQLEAGDTIQLRKAFRIQLDRNVPDQTVLNFTMRISENGTSHEDSFTFTANAPLIKIKPEYRPLAGDGTLSTHISTSGPSSVTFTIHNTGHSPADLLAASLQVKAPFVETENPIITHNNLDTNEELQLTYQFNTLPNSVSDAWLQAVLDVQYGDKHALLDTIIQYGCIWEDFETPVTNEIIYWNKLSTDSTGNWLYCSKDAYSGTTSIITNPDMSATSVSAVIRHFADHPSYHKFVSFYFKTDESIPLTVRGVDLISKDWQYAEVDCAAGAIIIWNYRRSDPSLAQALIDKVCFPSRYKVIAYAGDNLVSCAETPVELSNAYAYECDSVLWTSEGDGHFSCDTIVNPSYYPGTQDLSNGVVVLTLTAFGNDTMVSSVQVQLTDEISLGAIIGDEVVNKYKEPISRYSIENHPGWHYQWQIEPANAGTIYNYGNTIDVQWNQLDGDAEVTLSVTVDHNCSSGPITKHISLIGYNTAEWHPVDFTVYPNPTDGMVNLTFGETLAGKATIEVYNLLGERMATKGLDRLPKGGTIGLNLSKYASGLYIIKLNTPQGCFSKKVSLR